jgi:hypothetical protein
MCLRRVVVDSLNRDGSLREATAMQKTPIFVLPILLWQERLHLKENIWSVLDRFLDPIYCINFLWTRCFFASKEEKDNMI